MAIPRAATDIEAINLALSLLREEEIADTDDDTKAAREARKWFGTARDETLRAHEWNFAEAWVTPAADPSTNQGPLGKRFPLPADCLAVRTVLGDSTSCTLGPDEWKVLTVALGSPAVETKVLVTNAAAPVVCYTRLIDDVRIWDEQFLVAFARRLAGYMAPAFGGSIDATTAMDQAAERKINAAERVDAREKAPTRVSQNVPYLMARYGWRRPW